MKRSKIFITASMCLICLAMLVVGVYAAVVVDFSISGTLSYDPSKIYYDISAQVYRGPDYLGVKPVTNQESYTLAKTSEEYTTGNDVIEIAPWSPSSVSFTSTDKFIQYRIIIKNNSNEALSFIPTKDLTQTDVEIVEEVSAILRIESGDTAEYRITYEYTGSGTASTTFNQTFDLQKTSQLLNSGSKYATEQSGVTFTANSSGVLQSMNGQTPRVLIIPNSDSVGNVITSTSDNELSTKQNSVNTKYVIFAANVSNIGDDMFNNMHSMAAIGFPNSLKEIGFSAFHGCQLMSIHFPNSVTTIDSIAFGMTNIVRLELPNSVINLGSNIFEMCYDLLYVNIQANLTELVGTFMDCASLVNINLPESLSTVGSLTFKGCHNLTYIKLPSMVNSILEAAFELIAYEKDLSTIDMSVVDFENLIITDEAFYTYYPLMTNIVINKKFLSIATSKFTSAIVGGTYMANKLQLVDENNNVLAIWSGTTWGVEVAGSLQSNVTYNSNNVLVKADVSFKQGATVDSATVKESFTAYTYTPYADGSPQNTTSKNGFYLEDGVTSAANWNVNDIIFTEDEMTIVFETTFTNYTRSRVWVHPESNAQTIMSNFAKSTYSGGDPNSLYKCIRIYENYSTGFVLNAYTGTVTSSNSKIYRMEITLNNNDAFATAPVPNITIDFNVEKFTVNSSYFVGTTTITGLSTTYKNLPQKPSTLVIPSTCRTLNLDLTGFESENIVILSGTTSVTLKQGSNSEDTVPVLYLSDTVTTLTIGDTTNGAVHVQRTNIPNISNFTLNIAGVNWSSLGYIYLPENVTSLTNQPGEDGLSGIIISSSYFDFPTLTYVNCNLIDATTVDWSDSRTVVGTSDFASNETLRIKVGVGEIEDAKSKLTQSVMTGYGASGYISQEGAILTDGITMYTWNGSAWVNA